MKLIKILTCITFFACFSCDTDDNIIELGELPTAPEISVRQLPESPNFVEVELLTTDVFGFVWDAPGGNPDFSQAIKDTIFYVDAGEYDISVHISAKSGNGTATSKETVLIAEDAQGICDDFLDVLTGGCATKCWKLSEAAGSVKVGPSELSGEWFTSPGIDPSQVDDRFCFSADGFQFEYKSGDGTFSACSGYVNIQDFPNPPDVKFRTADINTEYADTELTFSEEIYFGTEDSGPVYQVVSLNEEEMIILAPIKSCDGAPSNGWFTYTFLAAED